MLADISGYTRFMAGVEQVHGVDFGAGIPAGYSMLGALLDTIIAGVEPDFAVVKLEGDAVFAAAPAASLDGQGDQVLEKLQERCTARSSMLAREPSPRATMSAQHVPRWHPSTSRRCSIGGRRCARRSGPAATCSARP